MIARQVAALFVRADSIYKALPGVDCWDIERDARKWPGGAPVVAHPPCRAWGQLRKLANPRPDEKALAVFAVEQVRKFGGVLEHPKNSTLWPAAGLPEPCSVDAFGGWTLPIDQNWFGHRAQKPTRLYIVGCGALEIPPLPIVLGQAERVVGCPGRRADGSRMRAGDVGYRREVSKAEREHTPPDFARWLVELARRCKV